MTEADVELMVPLYNYYVRETSATVHQTEISLAEMRDILLPADPRYGSWKIILDGRPDGYLLLRKHRHRESYDTTAEISIYLDPAWPGKGIGTQALSFGEYRAKERGFHVLLAIMPAENMSGIRLFERQGFEECARFKEITKRAGRFLDVLYFEKILA